jgi:hypothetical protein
VSLPVNRFSKNFCKRESPRKNEETETNRNLLASTVQKLEHSEKDHSKIKVANQDFTRKTSSKSFFLVTRKQKISQC